MADYNGNNHPADNNEEEPKTRIDIDALANKVANTAGRYARKGVDFVGKAINPENIKKVGSKVRSVADSVSAGWSEAGLEDHTDAEEERNLKELDSIVDSIRSKASETGAKVKDKVAEFTDKNDDKHDDPADS